MGTLGSNVNGSGTTSSSTTKISIGSAVAASGGIVTAGHARAWLSASGSAGTRLVIYADNGSGAPGALLAVSDEVVVTTTTADTQQNYTFSGANQITLVSGTTYWIGLMWNDPGTPSLIHSRGSTSNVRWERSGSASPSWTYPNAPSTFGTVEGPFTGPSDIWIDYNESSAPTVGAGTDRTWGANNQLNRTATEADNGSAITSRAWTITAGPAGVGTTIGTAAALSWTPTVAGTYTIQYAATNANGTGTDTAVITVIAVETHRLYLNNVSADWEPGAAAGTFWDSATIATGIQNPKLLGATKQGASTSIARAETVTTNPDYPLLKQFVSYPMSADGVITGDWGATIGCGSSDEAGGLLHCTVGLWVTVGNTSALRGGVSAFAAESNDIMQNPAEGDFIANDITNTISFLAGDRIVLEVGYGARNSVTTSYTGTIYYGGTSGTDLTAADTDMTHPGWVEVPMTPGITFVEPVAPGSVYDLSEWHLTTTRDSGSGDAEQIDQPELATFTYENWYVDDQDRIVAIAPVSGFTTSGASGATRMELRQHDPNYDLTAFDPDTATQEMIVTTYPDPTNIAGGTNPRKEMIIWQIHGAGGTPPLLVSAEYHVDPPRLRVFKDGPGVDPNYITGISPTNPVTIKCRVAGGRVKLWLAHGTKVDLPSTPQYDYASTAFADVIDWYFKVGAYNKTTIASGSTGQGIAKIAYLELNGVVLGPGVIEDDPFPQMAHFFGAM